MDPLTIFEVIYSEDSNTGADWELFSQKHWSSLRQTAVSHVERRAYDKFVQCSR